MLSVEEIYLNCEAILKTIDYAFCKFMRSSIKNIEIFFNFKITPLHIK